MDSEVPLYVVANGKKTLFKDVLDKNGYSDVPSIAK